MKKRIAILCTMVFVLTAVLSAAVRFTVRADASAIELAAIESPVSFHTDLQKEVLEAGYENITDYYNLNMKEKVERSIPEGVDVAWTYEGQELPETFTISVSLQEDITHFDIHSERMLNYLADPDAANVFDYAKGAKDYSKPEKLVCDFSGDEGIGESETYIFQKSADEAFTDPMTVTGLEKKEYELVNLLLGEHFFWRGGADEESITASPIHEVQVNDIPPRVCSVAGVVNVRDIGGYESALVEGGRIRQGVYYRGGKLNSIKKKGKPQLHEELGVGLEIDLRDEQQCTGPYVDGVEYFPVPIPSGTEEERFAAFAEEYQKIYGKIAETDQVIYLHCSAGADRTGIVTFMLLAVCGVQYEDIARDYMFTNFADQGKREIDALNEWWEQLDALEGETPADKAAAWMISKGVTLEQIEMIRTKLVEGYGE